MMCHAGTVFLFSCLLSLKRAGVHTIRLFRSTDINVPFYAELEIYQDL